MPHRHHAISAITPSASPEEAAAVVAALERFLRETTPTLVAEPAPNPWHRAALLEGTGREPDAPSPWGDPVPW